MLFSNRTFQFSYSVLTVLHIAQFMVEPPSRYPDIFVVLNVMICMPVFVLCWVYGMKRQLEVGFAIMSQ